MSTPPPPASGRHAKPPSKFATTCDEALRSFSGDDRRLGRLVVAGCGAGALALAGVVTVVVLSAGGAHPATAAHPAVRRATPAAEAATVTATAIDPGVVTDDTDQSAVVAYFGAKDAKVAGHVKRISLDGQFFRVYTDYPEGDANSPSAISLCEWTSAFLKDQGDPDTFVFVHGTSSDNGSVVLANKVSPTDSCKVDETK